MFALQRKEAKLEGRVLRVVRAKDNRPEQQKKVSHKRKPKLKRHDGCQGNGITSKAIKSTVKMKFGKRERCVSEGKQRNHRLHEVSYGCVHVLACCSFGNLIQQLEPHLVLF